MDDLDDFMMKRPPTARRPLLGLTVLVVEDSRFACEAMRLLCLRSGARIRRADSLQHARRHLAVYRPAVVIVDLGLPDGPGESLINDLTTGAPRVDVVLGTSGDPDGKDRALAAGADGFFAKPVQSLAQFQHMILSHLPEDRQPCAPWVLTDECISPDPMAYRDDLAHVADVLDGQEEDSSIDYITQFLSGVAQSANDTGLGVAVGNLARARRNGQATRSDVAQIAAMVQERLSSGGPL
ncbi:MAG: two-component system OmpR family response regulator [Paracoccaceae bacterium]|jgi:two-component system OmpR family response regulator